MFSPFPPLAPLVLDAPRRLTPARVPAQKARDLLKLPARVPAEIVELARSGVVLPVGWGRSKRKLDSVGACRQEAARLYHAAAAGKVAPEDLSRGIYALDKISRMAEVAELEKRVEQLEALLAQREKP